MNADFLFKPYSKFDLRERVIVKGLVEVMDYGSRALALSSFCVLPYLCQIKHSWTFVDFALMAWCVAEIAFSMWIHIRAAKMQNHCHVPEMDEQARMALAKRVVSQLDDPASLLNWADTNTASSLELLLTRGFLGKDKHELAKSERVQAQKLLEIFQTSEFSLPEQHYSKTKIVLPSIHPILYNTRSFLFYAVSAAIRFSGSIDFYRQGLLWHDLPTGLGYWIYHPTEVSNQPPILYFHGIGFGLTQMHPHITSLLEKYPNRILILFNLPQISMSPLSPVATEDEILHAIDILFHDNNLTTVSAFGHSFGTFICMWLATRRPTYLAKLTFIDPVCFMAWNACLIKRACHAEPTTAVHHYVRNIISRDLNFSLATGRRMYWPYTFQICDAFPCPTNIYLAKNDWVIDAPATYAYLIDRKATLDQTNVTIHMNDIDHLQFMFTPKLRDQINICL
ncbi:hypothetical protein DSO57_1016766 [Entomophthora muscae]|uniref:Uncharacterized protein n=2 Tax=Entomophthora muscae TaxID=34485 RepID=A0ACC2RIH0_9FUNG|nr:hypothetical protein DSO57_1020272 [Entomophthora muscae]KAJ9069605.1 hypothetical protein DSO57_1016766 [Entomophthora muscae]